MFNFHAVLTWLEERSIHRLILINMQNKQKQGQSFDRPGTVLSIGKARSRTDRSIENMDRSIGNLDRSIDSLERSIPYSDTSYLNRI